MGLVIALLVDWVQTENLLYLAALLDVATMATVVLASRGEKSGIRGTSYRQISNRRGFTRMATGMQRVARSHYVLGVVGLVVLTVAVSTQVEFQWKVTAAGVLHRDEHDPTAYFGYYYAGLYLLTGLLQVFLTGRLLQRFGPIAGLTVFPIALLVASVGVLTVAGQRLLLASVTLAKGCDAFKRSLHDPAIQLLYLRLPKAFRRQAIALVTGVSKPLAEAGVAVAIFCFAPLLDTSVLSFLVVLLIVGWLSLLIVKRRQYRG